MKVSKHGKRNASKGIVIQYVHLHEMIINSLT